MFGKNRRLSMRKVIGCLALVLASVPNQYAQTGSIFRLVISGCANSPGQFSQSAFKLDGAPALITALHGVAGCTSITARTAENALAFEGRSFVINQADVAYDVASLTATPSLRAQGGLPSGSKIPAGFDHLRVWGFPSGRVVSRGEEVTVAAPPLIFLSVWVMQDAIRVALKERQSPNLSKATFLDIQGALQPGHSGAPLLNTTGHVVGVCDGGLDGGTTGHSWAAPWAHVHLVPFTAADNLRLGHPPKVLFSYNLDSEPLPSVATRPVPVGAKTTLSLGSTGYIPGLSGRLKPILDSSNRTYLYASNIAIDGGKPQPADIRLNQPMQLEDSEGNVFSVLFTSVTSTGATLTAQKLTSDHIIFVPQLNAHVADETGSPVANANVEVTFPDGTFKASITDSQGQTTLDHLKSVVGNIIITQPAFVAASFPQQNLRTPLEAHLNHIASGGSLMLDGNTGVIPGLDGRLNPIHDGSNRNYLYASNIAIEGGKPQPVDFSLNTPIAVEDSHGARFYLSVIAISNSSSTIQYSKLPPVVVPIPTADISVIDTRNNPIPNATVVAVFNDGTVLSSTTDAQGVAKFTGLKQSVLSFYVAHAGYSAADVEDHDATHPLQVKLASGGGISSIAFLGSTGDIPGLQGRLDLHMDSNRHYVYADGIDIKQGKSQPAFFRLGQALTLRDTSGATFEVKIRAMANYAALLEYKRLDR